MKVYLAWIVARRRQKQNAANELLDEYLKRIKPFAEIKTIEATTEAELIEAVGRLSGRTKPYLVLLDSRGELRSSEEIAGILQSAQQRSVQNLVFAIGGADGWSAEMLRAADERLSFGRITLPHELARVVLAEQVYRAFTILAGHPYHAGH